MERDRFMVAAEEMAERLASEVNLQITDEILERFRNYKYAMFRADCSDDYFGRTLPEQRRIKEGLTEFLIELGIKMEGVRI